MQMHDDDAFKMRSSEFCTVITHPVKNWWIDTREAIYIRVAKQEVNLRERERESKFTAMVEVKLVLNLDRFSVNWVREVDYGATSSYPAST